jgi:hypothetical protein
VVRVLEIQLEPDHDAIALLYEAGSVFDVANGAAHRNASLARCFDW